MSVVNAAISHINEQTFNNQLMKLPIIGSVFLRRFYLRLVYLERSYHLATLKTLASPHG